jgi:hypothetical protein
MTRRDELVALRDTHRAEMQRILTEELTRPYSDYWAGEFQRVSRLSWDAQLAIGELDKGEQIKAAERERVLSAIEAECVWDPAPNERAHIDPQDLAALIAKLRGGE